MQDADRRDQCFAFGGQQKAIVRMGDAVYEINRLVVFVIIEILVVIYVVVRHFFDRLVKPGKIIS
ncbi:hypothetical protein D3C87_1823460 [compost metagenome]